MIYTPQKNPKQSIIQITLIVLISILGSIFINELFIYVGLFFWLQYTAILSYLQFKNKTKPKPTSPTNVLLNPQIRFFLFELLAIYGIYHAIFRNYLISYSVLLAWWLFALNFYFYYKNKK